MQKARAGSRQQMFSQARSDGALRYGEIVLTELALACASSFGDVKNSPSDQGPCTNTLLDAVTALRNRFSFLVLLIRRHCAAACRIRRNPRGFATPSRPPAADRTSFIC